jgi:hypothetical protein
VRAKVTGAGGLIVALISLCGCGGQTSANSVAIGPFGKATFQVTWPVPTARLVPSLAKSIAVQITDKKQFTKAVLIARPATGTVSTTTIDGLPVGTIYNSVTAYPNADGTGTAQATGADTITVEEDQTAPVTITLASTISQMVVAPTNLNLALKQTATLAAKAVDATGAMVLAPIQYSSADATVATVDISSGLVTGVKQGATVITVQDPESKVKNTVQVNVSSAELTITPNPYTFKGYGDSYPFKVAGGQAFPTGTQFKWTCSYGNLAAQYPTFQTVHSFTSTSTSVTYTDISPLDGSSLVDTLTVQQLDSNGNPVAHTSESFNVGGTRFQDVVYANGNVQSFYEQVPGGEFCPASNRVPNYITNYQGISLDCFFVESETSVGSPILSFGLMVKSGSTPAVGDKFAVQYYSYAPFLVPGIAEYGGNLLTFPNDSINGTLTITSKSPDPRGGTFVGYSFSLDTSNGTTTGYGLATLRG